MPDNTDPFETLKQILRHVRDPEALDHHPWTGSLFVQASPSQDGGNGPGGQLVKALAQLFPQLQPSTPPRRGKRLDPRWGEFGLLAALYFTPFNHGSPYPTTLMEAWGRIDEAILFFVYGKPAEDLRPEEIQKYRLVGDDLEYGSASTLSGWLRKGLQRFADLILDQERFLSRRLARSSILLEPDQASEKSSTRTHWRNLTGVRRGFWPALLLLLFLLLGLGAYKGWKIYEGGMQVYQDISRIRRTVTPPLEIEKVQAVAPALKLLQTDLSHFKQEARPALWLSARMGWLPEYGSDLASAPALIDLTDHLLTASIQVSDATRPIQEALSSENSPLDPARLTALLLEAGPQLEQAHQEIDQALLVRQSLNVEDLSPRLKGLLVDELDPALALADEGLSLASALPKLLGAENGGPKTYLLLVQNEDELRPTGGFITSVGNLVVHNGQVISLEFESVDSEVQEDWSRPYPAAPWQMEEYMNSRVLILRDSNWFSDFPTSVKWAEYLYAYTHDHSVDGVVAFDQQFLVMLMKVIGPLEVEDAPYPLTSENVIEYMRQAKVPLDEGADSTNWYRKEFIRKIAGALLLEIDSGKVHDWQGMAKVLTQAMEERHLLLQFDDPDLTDFLARRGWDNAVRPAEGDYLLVTDTNMGFNKTSAVVDVSLSYDVDLSDISAPESTLTVIHKNNAGGDVACIPWDTRPMTDQIYPVNRCYWTYLRVYKQAGVELLDATPQAIPGDWMLMSRPVPARVDEVDEGLEGVQAYGTMLVVPAGDSLGTSFQFGLPDTVLISQDSVGTLSYHLHIQKQPGTRAHPVVIRIHLPNWATVEAISMDAVRQDRNLLVQTDLRTDVDLEVVFTAP